MRIKELIENKSVLERNIDSSVITWEEIIKELDKCIKELPKEKRYLYIQELASIKNSPKEKLTEYLAYINNPENVVSFYYTFSNVPIYKIIEILGNLYSYPNTSEVTYNFALHIKLSFNRMIRILKNNFYNLDNNYVFPAYLLEEVNNDTNLKEIFTVPYKKWHKKDKDYVIEFATLKYKEILNKLYAIILKTNNIEDISCFISDFEEHIDLSEIENKKELSSNKYIKRLLKRIN